MGIYSTAHLVYGWKVPSDTWLVDDLEAHLDERLQGSGVGFYLDGSYEWETSEQDLILTVGEAPSYSSCEGVETLSQDAFDFTLTADKHRALQKQIRDRLGVSVEGYAEWHLGCSIG